VGEVRDLHRARRDQIVREFFAEHPIPQEWIDRACTLPPEDNLPPLGRLEQYRNLWWNFWNMHRREKAAIELLILLCGAIIVGVLYL
jgi:hypothetical protein